jgi:hypothetical protein
MTFVRTIAARTMQGFGGSAAEDSMPRITANVSYIFGSDSQRHEWQ